MIQANELRIGNYVQVAGHIYVCDSIQKDGGIFSPIKLMNPSDYIDMPYNPTPIPLTEEILLKSGFEKHGKVVSYLSLNTGLSDGYDDVEALLNWSDFTEKNEGELLFVFEGKGRWINISHIKHLHQLQNLYFALTGEELTIDL